MPPAIIAAGIGAAASIGGGLLASSATKKAANKASDTAANTAQMNNALTQGIYNQNTANLSTFMQSGQQATGTLNGLLYGPQQSPQQPAGPAAAPPMAANALTGAPAGSAGPPAWKLGPDMAAIYAPGGIMEAWQGQQQPMTAQPAITQQGAQQGPNAQSAWDQFRNSTNYQFRLNEGLKGANQGYAARGTLQSGAALKGLNNYAQQFASNELGNYMNLLGQQQQVGLSGANALAGVGTNMVGAVTANNNMAGSAAANAALMGGQANANLYGGIGNALGGIAGSFASSYGQPKAQAGFAPNRNAPWYVGAY